MDNKNKYKMKHFHIGSLSQIVSGSMLFKAIQGSSILLIPLTILSLVAYFYFPTGLRMVTAILFIDMVAVLGYYLFMGTSGVPCLGHSVFMLLGAQFQSVLTLDADMKSLQLPNLPVWLAQLNLGFLPATLITLILVGIIALLIGIPFCKTGDAATGIVSICLLVVIYNVVVVSSNYTGGIIGLFGMPEYTGFWAVFGIAAVIVVLARYFRDSVTGLELRASRENREAAEAIGINVPGKRLYAWVLSALVMAMAGILWTNYLTVIKAETFYLGIAFHLIALLIVGGMTTVSGAVVGTVCMTFVIEVLSWLGEGPVIGPIDLPHIYGLTTMGTGIAIIIVMIWRQEGLLPYLEIDEKIANWRRVPTVRQSTELGSHVVLRQTKQNSRSITVESSNAVVVDNIGKNFGGLQALNSVSLNITQGEILGLIGPNGSGKTTLINSITGAFPISSGRISLQNTDITNYPMHKIARLGICRTFQNIQLFSNMTVFENILTAAHAKTSRTRQQSPEEISWQLLNEFGLENVAHHLAGTLPYGSQRALEIARSLATEPKFLMLDEPAAGMIKQESDQLIEILFKIRNEYELGIMVIDHDLPMIVNLCDRVIVLNKGELIAEGLPEEVRSNPHVIEAYIGDKEAMELI